MSRAQCHMWLMAILLDSATLELSLPFANLFLTSFSFLCIHSMVQPGWTLCLCLNCPGYLPHVFVLFCIHGMLFSLHISKFCKCFRTLFKCHVTLELLFSLTWNKLFPLWCPIAQFLWWHVAILIYLYNLHIFFIRT